MAKRTVRGATSRVVVVGAGLSGLAAALHLRGAGCEVEVLERADHVGGRVGRYRLGPDPNQYEIDSGATVLTMPWLVDEALAAVGAAPLSALDKLSPAYFARFADHSHVEVYSDPDLMAAEVERAYGSAEASRYRSLRTWLESMFNAEFDGFIASNFDSPFDLLATPQSARDLLRIVTLGGFRRLGPKVARLLSDERLRRVFTFQALYAGLAPSKALALYGSIPYMDTGLGVYYPRGGMRRIAADMAEALIDAGGRIELNTEVAGLEFRGRRATGIRTATGELVEFDAVVLTADLPASYRLMGKRRPRQRPLRAAPSAVVIHGTVPVDITKSWPTQAHHTVDFGEAWESTFSEITALRGRGRTMSDPSLLITRPALTDSDQLVTRDGVLQEPVSILAPCPNLHGAQIDWSTRTRSYQAELLAVLGQRGYSHLESSFTIDHIDTPATWAAAEMLAGTPFSAAHLFRQTGPFRPRNLPRRTENVVLAGCGTVPGVGIPPALLSGKLAAWRIIGEPPRGGRGV